MMRQWTSRLGCEMQILGLLRTASPVKRTVHIWFPFLKTQLRLFLGNTQNGKSARSQLFTAANRMLRACSHASNNLKTAEMMFIKSDIFIFNRICQNIPISITNSDKNRTHFTWRLFFWGVSAQISSITQSVKCLEQECPTRGPQAVLRCTLPLCKLRIYHTIICSIWIPLVVTSPYVARETPHNNG